MLIELRDKNLMTEDLSQRLGLYAGKMTCDVCRASLVTDAVAVPVTFDQSYHLLELRNNGGLMIPSKGTVKVSKNIHQLFLYTQLAFCPTMIHSPTHPLIHSYSFNIF